MDRVLWFMYNYRIIITIAAALEMLKMGYIIFTSCCTCFKKPKSFLVGILDLMFGVPGLAVIGIPLIVAWGLPSDPSITVVNEDDYNEKDLLNRLATPILLLSGFPTLTGLLSVFAVACKSYCFANIAILVRFIIILLWSSVIVIFTLFYISYYKDTDYSQTNILVFFRYIHFFFGAPGTFGITQTYFIYLLCNFRSYELTELMYPVPQPRRDVEMRHLDESVEHMHGLDHVMEKADV